MQIFLSICGLLTLKKNVTMISMFCTVLEDLKLWEFKKKVLEKLKKSAACIDYSFIVCLSMFINGQHRRKSGVMFG